MRSKRTSEPVALSYAPRPRKGYERRLYGLYLAHDAVRLRLPQAAVEAELDPVASALAKGSVK
jgi:hypothetical protein